MDPVRVECPCCGACLVVDPSSGDVLSADEPKHASRSFEDAVGEVRSGKQRREDAFSRAFDRTRRLDEVLDKKFAEAKKKAESDPSSKPRGPFDSD